MDFNFTPIEVKTCPDCEGKGKKPYPYCFNTCNRCGGTGKIVRGT